MQKLVIEGGIPLEGEIFLHGAKNSALPILAGTLLCDGETTLENCPRLTDVFAACRILTHLGCRCMIQEHTVTVQVRDLRSDTIPEALMQEMRSSIIFLGAVLGRSGSCHLSYPGGCELGPRPIDMHLDALRQMGAHFSVHGGQLDCTAPEGLHGAAIHLPFPSVGATENVMLAAVLAEGRTVLHNAAREPEICDLAAFLRTCGADIAGDGESTLVIRGVERLKGGRYAIMPDRIAGVTYLGAAAITGGTVCLRGVNTQPMENMLPVLEQTGCRVFPEPDRLHLLAPRRLKAVPSIRTMPHPGFPTDAQAIFMAMLSLANGVSVLEENIFDSRIREPLPSCGCPGENGGKDPRVRQDRRGHRGALAERCIGGGNRSAWRRSHGACRAGRTGKNRGAADLPHRPGIRVDRDGAARCGRKDHTGGMNFSERK